MPHNPPKNRSGDNQFLVPVAKVIHQKIGLNVFLGAAGGHVRQGGGEGFRCGVTNACSTINLRSPPTRCPFSLGGRKSAQKSLGTSISPIRSYAARFPAGK